MRELLGLKWVSPPLLAAPAFDWYPQIHVEFRFALLLFGGRVIADNQLRLLFLTGSYLSTIPSSRITLWGLQPLDPSFYLCEGAEWLLMGLSCDNSSEICPFITLSVLITYRRRSLSHLLASRMKDGAVADVWNQLTHTCLWLNKGWKNSPTMMSLTIHFWSTERNIYRHGNDIVHYYIIMGVSMWSSRQVNLI